MSVLTAERRVREENWKRKGFTLLSGTKAFQGGAAFLTAAGKVVPAQNAAAVLYLGLFTETVDATAADKPVQVELTEEVVLFAYVNASGGDAVAATDIGKVCYFLDDQTVQITPTAKVAGRAWKVADGLVLVERLPSDPLALRPVGTLPAFAAADCVPAAAAIINGALYDVPATAANSTVTLPAGAPDGTVIQFAADGTKNGHTVQYRDATGPTNLTAALTASKRHLVIATKLGGKWFANADVSP
jgi:hypothetical protein